MTTEGTQEADAAQPSAFGQAVAMAESMDPTAGFAGFGPPDSSELFARFPELAEVATRDVTIEGRHGDVPGRMYRGPAGDGTAFVWVHGGAFIGGNLDFGEAHWVALAIAAAGFPVLSLDYRKSLRGVHYPVPSDDVLDGWLWATAHVDELGARIDDLHLGGASAGGNLVAGVTKRLRDGAGPLPSSLVLVYPIVHGELPALPPDLQELAAAGPGPGFSPDVVREMNLQYAGAEAVLDDPYAFAPNGELAGQPPVFVLNSESDFLRASGQAYAEALRAAGVDVTVVMEPGTSHGHVNGPDMTGAQDSIERIVTWLRDHARPEARD